MKALVTIFSMVTILSSAALSKPEPVAELKQLAESLPPEIDLNKSNLGVAEFCRVNGYRDSIVPESASNAWSDSFVASKEHRNAILQRFTSITYPVHMVQAAIPMTNGEIEKCNIEVKTLERKKMDQSNDVKASVLQGAYFCKELTLANLVQCSSLVPELIEYSKPRGDVNLIEVWKKVLYSPVYIQVMKKIALQNYQLVQADTAPSSRFFDDFQNEFRAQGLTAFQAEEATWSVMAILASNGSNSYAYTPCNIPDPTRATIALLSLTSSVLDRLSAAKGFLYTYPKEVQSLCDYGKNYHFWMSAFLAREAVKRTDNVTASAAAVFTINKGYQFMKTGGGRDRTKAFKLPALSNYSNNMRLDMVQAAAGAWFGALSAKSAPRNLNAQQFESGMRKMFEGIQPLPQDPGFKFPSMSEPQRLLGVYSDWRKILNPNAAYLYFEAELKKAGAIESY